MTSAVAALALETLGPLVVEVDSSRLLETLLAAAEATLSSGWHPRGKPRLALIVIHPQMSVSDIRLGRNCGVVEKVLYNVPEESSLEMGSRTIGLPANAEVLRRDLSAMDTLSHICFIGIVAADDMFLETALRSVPRSLLTCANLCIVHNGAGFILSVIMAVFERWQLPRPNTVTLKSSVQHPLVCQVATLAQVQPIQIPHTSTVDIQKPSPTSPDKNHSSGPPSIESVSAPTALLPDGLPSSIPIPRPAKCVSSPPTSLPAAAAKTITTSKTDTNAATSSAPPKIKLNSGVSTTVTAKDHEHFLVCRGCGLNPICSYSMRRTRFRPMKILPLSRCSRSVRRSLSFARR